MCTIGTDTIQPCRHVLAASVHWLVVASARHSVCSHHMARLPHSIIILCRAPRPGTHASTTSSLGGTKRIQNPPLPPRDSQRMKRLSSKMAHVFNRGPRWICPILTEQNGEGTCQYETEQGDTVLTLPKQNTKYHNTDNTDNNDDNDDNDNVPVSIRGRFFSKHEVTDVKIHLLNFTYRWINKIYFEERKPRYKQRSILKIYFLKTWQIKSSRRRGRRKLQIFFQTDVVSLKVQPVQFVCIHVCFDLQESIGVSCHSRLMYA